jgi:hypothetical protein
MCQIRGEKDGPPAQWLADPRHLGRQGKKKNQAK